jgi:hypothetical protein
LQLFTNLQEVPEVMQTSLSSYALGRNASLLVILMLNTHLETADFQTH